MPTTLTKQERDRVIGSLQENVFEWTQQLCDSLAENYKRYHRRMIEANAERFNRDGERQDLSEYAQQQLDALDNGTFKGMKFTITTGKKYHKIISNNWDDRTEDYRSGGVHAFVDKKTGEVYKPASWNKAASIVRYDLRIIQSRMECYNRADWAGGYLYIR